MAVSTLLDVLHRQSDPMTEEDDNSHPASLQVSISVAVLLLLIPPIFAEWVNQHPVRSRNAKLTKYLMTGVITFNTISHLLYVGRFIGCTNCGLHNGSFYVSKSIVKGINMLFLVHRAKLVQGMSPILSKKWFEKILPSIIVAIVIILVSATIKTFTNSDWNWTCVQGSDWEFIKFCYPEKNEGEQHTNNARGTAALAIAVDLVITTFLMTLFVVPLYRVNNSDIGVMNDNQLKQRQKLKRLLIWSVLLTFINQVTSTMSLLAIVHMSKGTFYMYLFGIADPAINIWTLWLMVTRNRQYAQKICCCFRREGALSRKQSVALTDIPSNLRSASLHRQQNERQSSFAPELIIQPDPDLEICN